VKRVVITAGILLLTYIVAIIAVINWPTRRRHPEDAQAVGCLMLVAITCALLGGALFLAAHFHVRLLVYVIFAITVYPALYSIPQLAWKGWKAHRAKSAAKGRRILGDELRTKLTGHTHVFHRISLEPRREYDELKYYSPDGKLVCYERENGELKPLELASTWAVKDDLLHTLGQHRPGNRNVFAVWETPAGQIAYYIHLPFSTPNRSPSGTTTEVLAGEPADGSAGETHEGPVL
jgi:hypothetical protein